jgi:SAM-dependent methyltransferase
MSLQQRWNDLCARTIGSDAFWRLSVDHRAAHAALAPLIEYYAKGRVLDAGAGRMAWRSLLQMRASEYVATDCAQTHPDIALVADLTKGLPLDDGSFDTIFCCSVLEHVEDPFAAMAELSRLLRPGGNLIISVPFRYYLHGAPADYFRFTPFGVALMAQKAGLVVKKLEDSGGLAHEAANVLSLVLSALIGGGNTGIGISSGFSWTIWRAARVIDRLDRGGRFAQNVNAVLGKV